MYKYTVVKIDTQIKWPICKGVSEHYDSAHSCVSTISYAMFAGCHILVYVLPVNHSRSVQHSKLCVNFVSVIHITWRMNSLTCTVHINGEPGRFEPYLSADLGYCFLLV